MKKKTIMALGLALLMVLSVVNGTLVYAEQGPLDEAKKLWGGAELGTVFETEEPDSPDQPLTPKEEPRTEQHQASVSPETTEPGELELSPENVPEAVTGGEKTFTLTKKVGGTEEKVGDYDKFYDAVGSMDVNDKTTFYTIYVNKNAIIPADQMGGSYRTNNKFRLTSGTGGPFTLTREGKWGILGIQTDAELTVDNITLDGSGTCQCFFISNNGKVTIGDKAIIQNFVDTENEDGPAIHVTGGTLNILPGAVIQNNNSNMQGGAIQAYNGTTVNISGGTFKNNTSNTSDGGFLAAYGELKITGGTFEGNAAKKTAGAIIIGENSDATIENAIFKNNEARTGGAIYSLKEFTITDTTFENNKATWGGAVFASKKLTLSKGTFNNNTATSAGGALYLQGEAQITKSNFTENTSASDGGAVYSVNADTNIDGCTFENNSSGARGGALLLSGQKNYTIKNSTIKNNKAKNIGGGITAILGNLNVEDSTIDSNNSELLGGGIASVAQGTINLNKCVIKNNIGHGAGGAFVGTGGTQIKGTVNIKGTEFIGNNTAENEEQKNILGGGLYIDADITANISDSSKFINNKAGVGGAIFDAAFSYDNPADTAKYQNLTIDGSTEFKGNVARTNLYAPPTNYDKFEKLQFSDTSDVPHMKGMSKSLLNNYDINYMGDFLVAYDANGGKFKDGEAEKTENHQENEEITIVAAPVREGYKFMGWKGTKVSDDATSAKERMFKPGNTFKLDGNYTFVAQWEAKKPEPKPEPKPQEGHGGYLFFPGGEGDKVGTHIAYIKGYPDETVRPEGQVTRAEAVTMVVRLKGYAITEGQGIYKDVARTAWYAPYIEAAGRQGILEEKAGEAFRPNDPITRGELAQLISHIDDKNTAKAPFTDIEGHKYQDAINQSYGNKRILGYPDNTFKPDAPITRAETVAMLNRLFARSVKGEGLERVRIHLFNDLKDKTYWAYYEIMEASHTHTYVRIRPNTVEELWKTTID